MEETIKNKVAESGLITLDLEVYMPKGEVSVFDLKDYLFRELILKEKDFRASLSEMDWSVYQDKNVAVTCSADAVIPVWAYMLVVSYLQPFAAEVVLGTEDYLKNSLWIKSLSKVHPEEYEEKRVVVKGCGETPIPEAAYLEVTRILRPVAKSIMYGEPCSTVPIFKKR